jgi:hypothetical protein
MHLWYKKIDYILSVSNYEGSHQAVAEGMASGVNPLILPWPGAETIYPLEYVFPNVNELVSFVMSKASRTDTISYAHEHFNHSSIFSRLKNLCESLV